MKGGCPSCMNQMLKISASVIVVEVFEPIVLPELRNSLRS